jgi:hypothetical protein
MYNTASDDFAFVGGGCDNLAGSGTAATASCGGGAQAILGGAHQTLTTSDSTYPVGP